MSLIIDQNGKAITERKALGLALLDLVAINEELPPASAQAVRAGGIVLTGKTLSHRFVIESGTNQFQELLDSNTAHLVGITDFDKSSTADGGLHMISHIAIATTSELDSKENNVIATANFDRRIKADDAFLQAGILSIKVSGNQPIHKVRLADCMLSAGETKTGEFLYELPQGFYITNDQTVSFKLELPKVPNGITAGKFKAVEILFVGMHSTI